MVPMGVTSENVAKKYRITRQEMDAFACESHRRAAAAQDNNWFDAEIVSLHAQDSKEGSGRRGEEMTDGGIRRNCTVEGLAALKPVFVPTGGTTTAGNSSQTSDGAAAVLVAREQERRQMGLPVLCVWRHYVVVGKGV